MSNDAPPPDPGWNLPTAEASAPPSYDSLWTVPGPPAAQVTPPAGFGSTYYGTDARQTVHPTAPPTDTGVSTNLTFIILEKSVQKQLQ